MKFTNDRLLEEFNEFLNELDDPDRRLKHHTFRELFYHKIYIESILETIKSRNSLTTILGLLGICITAIINYLNPSLRIIYIIAVLLFLVFFVNSLKRNIDAILKGNILLKTIEDEISYRENTKNTRENRLQKKYLSKR